jgi:hypothetical protein
MSQIESWACGPPARFEQMSAWRTPIPNVISLKWN